jgi:hypothetical protein
MTLDSSRRAVFDTNELLENIVSYLPSSELSVLQIVSKQWRGVISSSPGLQDRMFLRPRSATTKEIWTMEDYTRFGPVEIISSYTIYLGRDGVPMFRRLNSGDTRKHGLVIPLTLNPILRLLGIVPKHSEFASPWILPSEFTSPWNLPPRSGLPDEPAVHRVYVDADWVSICIRPAALSRHCSLRSVYLSDPPCRVAQVKLLVEFQGYKPYGMQTQASQAGFRVESDAGLTIGEILKAASESARYSCCKFDDGYVWKDLRTELKDMIDETEQPSGWTGIYGVGRISLYIQMVRDGNDRPVVVSEEDRAAVLSDDLQTAVVTD